jgi:hypothetical protein
MSTVMDRMLGNHPQFVCGNRSFAFINLHEESNLISCYRVKMDYQYEGMAEIVGISPNLLSIETLKRLKIWDKVEATYHKVSDEVIANMPTARDSNSTAPSDGPKKRGRKRANSNIPRKFRCNKCDKEVYISPTILCTRMGVETPEAITEKMITGMIGEFKCPKCMGSKRGRTRNPLFKDIPKEIKCSGCQKTIVVPAQKVYDMTGGDKAKIKEYATTYLCRSCNPEWGSWLKGKRGRKAKDA